MPAPPGFPACVRNGRVRSWPCLNPSSRVWWALKNSMGDLACFAPLLKLRDQEERAYLDGLSAGRRDLPTPYQGYANVVRRELVRLMNENKDDEAIKLVQELRTELETHDNTNLGARFDSRSSAFLQGTLRFSSAESAALFACLMQTAARLPGIRATPDTRTPPGYPGNKGPLFTLWEQRGGWAGPGQVFADFVQEVENTRHRRHRGSLAASAARHARERGLAGETGDRRLGGAETSARPAGCRT
jgi:hypothetical protein